MADTVQIQLSWWRSIGRSKPTLLLYKVWPCPSSYIHYQSSWTVVQSAQHIHLTLRDCGHFYPDEAVGNVLGLEVPPKVPMAADPALLVPVADLPVCIDPGVLVALAKPVGDAYATQVLVAPRRVYSVEAVKEVPSYSS